MEGADALTSGTVKLPGIGPVKKVYLYVGVGAVGVLAAYIMYNRSKNAADEEEGYSDAELDDGLTTGLGSDVYQNPAPSNSNSYDDDVPAQPTTNIEWTNLVVERFSYLEEDYILGVLSKYLQKQKLSADEAAFIRKVWTAVGKPPEGPSNFYLTSDGSSPGSTTTPNAPTGLKVTATTTNSVSIDWSDVSGADGYEVYRSGSKVADTTGSSYTSTGLKANTKYSFYVKTKDNSKTSANSSSVTGQTKATTTTPPKKPVPSKPTYVTVTVKKYTSNNPPWESTISGIAAHYGKSWSTVWNDSKNAGLRKSRKDPKLIRPGDKVYVKK